MPGKAQIAPQHCTTPTRTMRTTRFSPAWGFALTPHAVPPRALEQRRQKIIIRAFSRGSVTVADYTILLTNLPPHGSVHELEEWITHHFETVLADPEVQDFHGPWRAGAGRCCG